MRTVSWKQTCTAKTVSSSEALEGRGLGRGVGDRGFFLCRQVGKDLKDIPADTKVVDATGKYVIPG